METSILLTYQEGEKFIVVFKYWKKGECACTAEKVRREFDKEPTVSELIMAI